MLILRKEQMAIFKADMLVRFEQQLVIHALQFAPRHTRSLGQLQLEKCIHAAVSRGYDEGFTLRGTIRLWLELTLMYGISFDTDPQLASFVNVFRNAVLSDHNEQLRCAAALRNGSIDFVARISGKNHEFELAAIERFRQLSLNELSARSDDAIIELLRRIHPEKADAAGASALQQIIQQARVHAETFKLACPAGPMAMTLLMFTFGHGCVTDPFFPWIADTLKPQEIEDTLRIETIRRKALRFITAGSEGI